MYIPQYYDQHQDLELTITTESGSAETIYHKLRDKWSI
jgi:hypothetical protein